MNISEFLTSKAAVVLQGKFPADLLPKISFEVAKNPNHGDYATNFAMIAARPLGRAPMDIASDLAVELTLISEIASASVAAPGFVNIRLEDKFLLSAAADADQISQVQNPQMIDLDYAGYNIGKALQIGHLRTTIVGDVLNRVLQAVGNRTKSYNHLGNWGRPMGLIIAWILEKYGKIPENMDADEFNKIYPASSERAKSDPAWMERARQITAEFQGGKYRDIYDWFSGLSNDAIRDVLNRLNTLPFDSWQGEKEMSEYIDDTERALQEKGVLELSDGALVVRTDADVPLIFKTSHGTSTYDATDLAGMFYREKTDNPDQIIYLTDVRQKFSFAQKFYVARLSGLTDAALKHIYFGAITGADGKPFKTRSGDAPSLSQVIDMTISSVKARVAETGKDISDTDIEKIAIAALKFNDLSHAMQDNYVFDIDALTNFEGHTGPYILYTAVRMNSILKKTDAGKFGDKIDGEGERAVIMLLSDFDRTIHRAAANGATDIVANYAYDLAKAINAYYHNYPVLRADIPAEIAAHRKAVISVSLRVLTHALDLLGINVPSEM